MANDVDRVIESLRQAADELENGEARLRDYNLDFVWDDDYLSGKNVDVWIDYD